MTTLSDYGEVFRDAYAALHGGRPDESGPDPVRRPGEALEEYLARTRSEALGRVQRQLSAMEPPEALRPAHELLVRLLAGAVEADAALPPRWRPTAAAGSRRASPTRTGCRRWWRRARGWTRS